MQKASKKIPSILTSIELISFTLLLIGIGFAHSTDLMHDNQTSKLLLLSEFIIILLIIRLISIAIIPSLPIRIVWLDVILTLFIIYSFLSRVIEAGITTHTVPYIEMVSLGVVYLLLRTSSKSTTKWLLYSIVLAAAIQAGYGALQLYGYYPSLHHLFRLTGGFFNPGPFAGYIVAGFSIAFTLLLYEGSIKGQFIRTNTEKEFFQGRYASIGRIITNTIPKVIPILESTLISWLPIATILLAMLVLPASQSRAAWVGVTLAFIWLLTGKYDVKKRVFSSFKNPILKASLCILIVAGVTSSALGVYNLKKGSADGRLLIWRVTTTMIKDAPILGHGTEMFKGRYMTYQAQHFAQGGSEAEAMVADDVRYAFNEPLRLWAEGGLVGLLLAASIAVMVFTGKPRKGSTRANHVLLIAAQAALLGTIGFSLFSYPSEILPIKLNGIILLAIVASQAKGSFVEIDIGLKKLLTPIKIVTGLIIIASILLVNRTRNEFNDTYKGWQSAFSTYSVGAYERSVERYAELYPKLRHTGDFLVNYGKALSMAGQHQQAIAVLSEAERYMNNTIVQNALGDSHKALGNFTEAEQAYITAYQMVPSRFYPLYLLATLYEQNHKTQKAVNTAKALLEQEIKVPSTAIEEMRDEMRRIIENQNP